MGLNTAKRGLEYLAIREQDCPEEYYATKSGKCVVCASGHTMWSDLQEAGFVPTKWKQNFDIVAVNRAIMDIPSAIDFGYSNHMDMMLLWS